MKVLLVIITSSHCLPRRSPRIGETVKQVEARYGSHRKIHRPRRLAQGGLWLSRFMIIVYFSGGISKRESFGRPDVRKLPREDSQRASCAQRASGHKLAASFSITRRFLLVVQRQESHRSVAAPEMFFSCRTATQIETNRPNHAIQRTGPARCVTFV